VGERLTALAVVVARAIQAEATSLPVGPDTPLDHDNIMSAFAAMTALVREHRDPAILYARMEAEVRAGCSALAEAQEKSR
jgi:hypothetical protein